MYKLKDHIATDHLAQILNSTNAMYSYNLRNSNILILLFVPRLNTEAEKKNSFHYKGAVGIVYQTLLTTDKLSLKYISNFRTILITVLI